MGFYSNFIKKTWGTLKPDEPKRNTVDLTLKGLDVTNTTRKKHLTYVRAFFKWARNEGYVTNNPTDGLKFKTEANLAEFYSPQQTKELLQFVANNVPETLGYYSLLIFAGLRPTEGARVQWQDINFKTGELYVRKGKTTARHVILEPVALEWMKYFREKTPKEIPFIPEKNLFNKEKIVRGSVERWIPDGLRHGFGTYFKNLKKDIALVADYMGNSPGIIKRHYARTIEKEQCETFWHLDPSQVLP